MIVSYTGVARVEAPGRPPFDAVVHVTAHHPSAVGATFHGWWNGTINHEAGLKLQGVVTLRLPHGRVGKVVMARVSGNFEGIGPVPI